MFILKKLNRKLLNYLAVALLAATFLTFPPAFTRRSAG